MQMTWTNLSAKPPGHSRRWCNTDTASLSSGMHCGSSTELFMIHLTCDWLCGNSFSLLISFAWCWHKSGRWLQNHLLHPSVLCAHFPLHSGLPLLAVTQVAPCSRCHVTHRATMKGKQPFTFTHMTGQFGVRIRRVEPASTQGEHENRLVDRVLLQVLNTAQLCFLSVSPICYKCASV